MELHEQIREYICKNFECVSDHPWGAEPEYEVFRHTVSRKWFALMMNLPRRALGMEGEEEIYVLNLKCEPRLVGSLIHSGGFYPAYHMNKEQWITAALDGSVSAAEVEMLIDLSFDLTAPKLKKAPRKKKTAPAEE